MNKNNILYRAGAYANCLFVLVLIVLGVTACGGGSSNGGETYSVGGTVSGLEGNLILQNNGGDDLTITSDGSFSFATSMSSDSTYNVTVSAQPSGQICTVGNGSGTIASENITNVSITCVNNYTVSGNISDLDGSITIQNNGGDDLTLTSDGGFTFATNLADGENYSVTVLTQPAGQNCTVSNGSGVIAEANVTNVNVSCINNSYLVGGTISGLTGSVTLQNNGTDDLTLDTDGIFSFTTEIEHGSTYNVTMLTQPNGQLCSVSNGSGTIASADVTNVSVTCVNTYTVGGNISGLDGSITIQNNDGDDLTLMSDGAFTFATPIGSGSTYNVSVSAQPSGQICTVSNGSGTIASANVTNVGVACVNTYTVGGNISGLDGSIMLQNNGSDDLTLTSNGAFTFTTAIANGESYNVTILTPPVGQTCTVNDGSGAIAGANVTNVNVSCANNSYSVGGTVSGLTGSVTLQNNGTDNLTLDADGQFTFATPIEHGSTYNVTVLTQPSGQTCTVSNGSGTIAGGDVTSVNVNCGGLVFPDVAGTWSGTQTYTAVTPQAGTCDHSQGESNIPYVSITQSGADLTVINSQGVVITGTISAVLPADITLSGSTTGSDPISGDTFDVVVNFTGQLDNAGVITGGVTVQYSMNATNTCLEEADFTISNIYTRTGNEDYSGLYGLEVSADSGRSIDVWDVDITGANMAFYNDKGMANVTSSNFDSTTGYFTMQIEDVENDTGAGTSEVSYLYITGLFVRADDDASGLPVLVSHSSGYWEAYDALDGTGNVTEQDYLDDEFSYGKRIPSSAYTRSRYYRKSGGGWVEGINIGLTNPPLKTSNGLYVEVLDVGSTQLCTSGQYHKARYLNTDGTPVANMANEEFQTKAYSFASCNTSDSDGNHSVVEGGSYTVRVRDTGPDGVIGGGDDFTVPGTSKTLVAHVHSSFFADKLQPNDFILNAARPSQTMKRGIQDGVINLFGFIDTTDSMILNWDALMDAERYQVQIAQTDGSVLQTRIETTGSPTQITLQPNTFNSGSPSNVRVVGMKTDSVNGAVATSESMRLQLIPGVNGLFNVELEEVVPDQGAHNTFQVALAADMDGNVTECEVTNSLAWQCNAGATSVDYANNQVSLSMTDMVGTLGSGTYTLVLHFDDSATGFVTSPDLAAINTGPTDVRLVNPELKIRSVRRSSGNNPIQTQVNIYNALAADSGELFNNAVFRADDNSSLIVGGVDTGSDLETIWDNTIPGLEWWTLRRFYMGMPIDDGKAQDHGTYVTRRTQQHWALGGGLLNSGLYKAVWNTSDPNLKFVFKWNYTQPDPSTLIAPQLTDVIVHIGSTDVVAGIGNGDEGSPIDISADTSFDLTWTGSTVANGEWQLRFTEVTSGFQIRTPWMDATHPDLSDNGDGTWTWTNPFILANPGEIITWRIHIRTRDAENTMLGIQRREDNVYVTNQ